MLVIGFAKSSVCIRIEEMMTISKLRKKLASGKDTYELFFD
jgi:hypothetical protein